MLIPNSGSDQARIWDSELPTLLPVEQIDVRDILAANLKALMASRPGLDDFKKIVAAGGPSNGTLDRIRRKAAEALEKDLAERQLCRVKK